MALAVSVLLSLSLSLPFAVHVSISISVSVSVTLSLVVAAPVHHRRSEARVHRGRTGSDKAEEDEVAGRALRERKRVRKRREKQA
ncbi:hypothetical protein V8C26DRAFT_412884 [Trichoderma gracile]